MEENKNEREQNQEQSQPKRANPKRQKAKQVVTFVCLGIAVACVIALAVLVNIST